MTRFDFTPYRRTTVGFDRLFDLLENNNRTNGDNYPPFNIARVDENRYLVTLAVAGFSANEIDITAQQNLLVVAGKKSEVEANNQHEMLHVGIANRNFERRFELADFVVVQDAKLQDGLLTIDLVREVPEAMKPKKIAITGATGKVIEGKKQ